MTGLDKGFTGSGEPRPEPGAGTFFPGPAARRGPVPPSRPPLSAPSALTSGANALPMTLQGTPGDITTAVDGRITIENGVIGKIAALAALEVGGVAALVPRPGAPGPGAQGPDAQGPDAQGPDAQGRDAARARAGVRVDLDEHADEVALDVAIAVEYGTVIKDVARLVKANVARVAGMMLGMRIAAVNVSVEDVRLPGDQAATRA
ncbi:Asp23/Gls24 family envelope stress response protein [Actinomadura sp. KC06]|uniref:Asp23/Gls24 family envelope stress response protein n=1 Tax=Actinomadura sp. KC06 TaxID=2530369 RepID=UPI00104C6355|nr:Asp23/Gls24 family envelope stress response protein [Actinomadura sp. KC06]TDD38880.1 Asp23/Gls24 family envelope stress response protein [Actinomadura sp. KC06]